MMQIDTWLRFHMITGLNCNSCVLQMDRASILGDAIEYLKELLQKINDLHNELESTPPCSALTPNSSFYPLTPTASALPCRIKEEICPSSFASPLSSPTGQPARVIWFLYPKRISDFVLITSNMKKKKKKSGVIFIFHGIKYDEIMWICRLKLGLEKEEP